MRFHFKIELPSLPSLPKRRARRMALAVVLALAVAVPGLALGSHQFGDVPDSNPFHADISAIANVGVTTGCGGGNYCPNDYVTREQMAAFMNRLGALGPGKTPVVNADKVDGLDSTQLLATSQQQGSAVVTNVSLNPPDGTTEKVEIIAPQAGKVFHGHINGSLAGPSGTTGTFSCRTAATFGVDLSTDTFPSSFRNANTDFVCTELYITATDTNDAVDAGATSIITASVYFETSDVTTLP